MTSPVSLPTGSKITAAKLDAYENLTGTWSDFTPTWTTTGTAPTLGDGALTARKMQSGKLVHYTGRLLLGSTTNVGTGDWRISVPTGTQNGSLHVGVAIAFDSSNILASRPIACWFVSESTFRFTSPAGDVASGTPFAWAQSDQLRWSIIYEAI